MLPSACDNKRESISDGHNYLLILTIIAASISLIIELLYIIETSKIITKLKSQFDHSGGNNTGEMSDADYKRKLENIKSQNEKNRGNQPQFQSITSHKSLYDKIDQENEQLDSNIKAKKARLMKEANWNELIFWDKIRLFDIWAIISIIANLS